MTNYPIFIVGCPRSGTSLVYSLLLASGDFAIYEAETHLLYTCPVKYGSLRKESNWQNFLNDWLQSKQFKRSGLDAQQFETGASNYRHSYFELLDYFMSEICKSQRKLRWAENTPNHAFVVSQIANYFPTAKFIHMIRDGRAVVSSLVKLGWVPFKFSKKSQLISSGISWERSVFHGKKARKRLADRYIEIRYEDIILNPESTLEKIGEFIETKLDIDSLSKKKVGVIGKQNTAYGDNLENENSLFSKNSLYRWQEILSEEEKRTLDATLNKTLKLLGYKCQSEKNYSVSMLKLYYQFLMVNKSLLKYKLGLGKFTKSGLECQR